MEAVSSLRGSEGPNGPPSRNRGTRGRGGQCRGQSWRGRGGKGRASWRGRGNFRGGRIQKPEYLCKKCNTLHGAGRCPAYGKRCLNCGQLNHYKVVCRHTQQTSVTKGVNEIQVKAPERGPSNVILESWSVEVDSLEDDRWDAIKVVEDDVMLGPADTEREYAEALLLVGKYKVVFKLDPGSEANILPQTVFELLNSEGNLGIYPVAVQLKGAFDARGKSVEGGVTLLTQTVQGDTRECEYLISRLCSRPILGKRDCENLKLLQRIVHVTQGVNTLELGSANDEFIKTHGKVFSGRGKLNHSFKIRVDPTVNPSLCPPRRYTYSIVERLKPKLESLEKQGVIVKITTEIPRFVSNLVIREKGDGDLRLCLDPESLNKAILKPSYVIPTLEEIACQVKDKSVFSVLEGWVLARTSR